MNTTVRLLLAASLLFPLSTPSVAQWIQQKSGIDGKLTDVVMLDSATVIGVGRNGSILRTTNAGASWIDVAAPLSYISSWNAVSFFDSLNGAVAGDRGVLLITTNGGKNWIGRQVPGGPMCTALLHVGSGGIFAGTDSGWVYSTSDTGRTWKSEKISAWPIRAIFLYRGPTYLSISKYALTSRSLCTQFVVPNPSWNEIMLQPFQGLGSEAFAAEYCDGGGAGFIVGVQGDLRAAPAIARRSMGDSSWRSVSQGISQDGTFLGVAAPSAAIIYVCGSRGMIYKSSDSGSTWTRQSIPAARSLNAVTFFNDRNGYAVGDSGLILRTSNGGVTGVSDLPNEVPQEFRLEQNYPNPFNPTTAISYELLAYSWVRLAVFDLLGREIALLVDEVQSGGRHVVRWDASRFPSGIYFCRMQAGSYHATQKLVLMK